MSEDNSLQRAHSLSAQASVLVRPTDADAKMLETALASYKEAADLFQRSADCVSKDDPTRRTLEMLTTQHRKLARDTERRIATKLTALSSLPGSSTHPPRSPNEQTSGSPSPLARRPSQPRRSGQATYQEETTEDKSKAKRPSSTHSIPPFSLRPVMAESHTSDPDHSSPLYSSTSSSEPPEESYLLPGAVPDTMDPFSRFWGMLENMLEEISFPKALTMAALDVPPPSAVSPSGTPERRRKSTISKEKSKVKVSDKLPSPTESYYVVPRNNVDDPAERHSSPSTKTNEELLLENESLRILLDDLARKAHTLDLANRTLTERSQERDKLVQSIVSDVRKEAKKAKQGQEIMRSQVLPPVQSRSASEEQAFMKKRVVELEDEVKHVREENNKLRMQLDKFREKWDKLKAKKEAKVAAAKVARAARNSEPI